MQYLFQFVDYANRTSSSYLLDTIRLIILNILLIIYFMSSKPNDRLKLNFNISSKINILREYYHFLTISNKLLK